MRNKLKEIIRPWAVEMTEELLDQIMQLFTEAIPEEGSLKDNIVNYPYELRNRPDEFYHYVRNQVIKDIKKNI